MNFFKKNYVFTSTVVGTLSGYIFLHPFINVTSEFLHVHGGKSLHMHWDELVEIVFDSFQLEYWSHSLAYAVLAGIGGYFFGRTVNAYRKMNEQLEKFSKIGINASAIIHDLNNPLTGIKWGAEMFKKSAKDEQQVKISNLVEQGAERIAKMIMDIKLLAHGEGKIELSKSMIDLESFIEEIVLGLELNSKVNIKSEFRGKVFVDKDYFERVLWNILKNAKEALEKTKNGKIEISIQEKQNSVIISISDNGPGMPREILQNIFELGQTSGKKGGSGIGLFSSKRIVEAHKGKIWVVSKQNQGTAFYIQIPEK